MNIQSQVFDKYIYDRELGLFWHKEKRSGCKVNVPAGTLQNGYIGISLYPKNIHAHRLIWMLESGSMPEKGMVVDHINRNRADNRIQNLRLVSYSLNSKNAKRSASNKSGVTGVRWNDTSGAWSAYIWNEGKQESKMFDAKIAAIKWRKAKEVEYGFSLSHGEAG